MRRACVISEDIADKYIIPYKRVAPDCVDQPFLGEHFVRMRSEMNQHLHHFGFEMPGLAVSFYSVDLRLNQPIVDTKISLHALSPHPATLLLHQPDGPIFISQRRRL